MAINKEIKDYVKVGENEWIEDFFLTAEKNQELKDLRADLTTETQRATDRETELDTKIDNTYDKITEESDDKLYTKINKSISEELVSKVELTKIDSTSNKITITQSNTESEEETTYDIEIPVAVSDESTSAKAGIVTANDKNRIVNAVVKNDTNNQDIDSSLGVTESIHIISGDTSINLGKVDATNTILADTKRVTDIKSSHTHIKGQGKDLAYKEELDSADAALRTLIASEDDATRLSLQQEKDRATLAETNLQNNIDLNTGRIESLEGRSVRYAVQLETNDHPDGYGLSQEQLQSIYEKAASVTAGTKAYDGTRLVDVDLNLVYTYFETDGLWHGPENDTVSTASNSRLGIVKGSATGQYSINVNAVTGEMVLNRDNGVSLQVLSDVNYTFEDKENVDRMFAQIEKVEKLEDEVAALTRTDIGRVEEVIFKMNGEGGNVVEGQTATIELVDATQTASGLFSKEDKAKLDNIEATADVNIIESIKANGEVLPVTDRQVEIPIPDTATLAESLRDTNSKEPVTYWSGTKVQWEAAVADGTITENTTWDIIDDSIEPLNIAQTLIDAQDQIPSSHAVFTALSELEAEVENSKTAEALKNVNTSGQDVQIWTGDQTSYNTLEELNLFDTNSIYVAEDEKNINIYKNGKSLDIEHLGYSLTYDSPNLSNIHASILNQEGTAGIAVLSTSDLNATEDDIYGEGLDSDKVNSEAVAAVTHEAAVIYVSDAKGKANYLNMLVDTTQLINMDQESTAMLNLTPQSISNTVESDAADTAVELNNTRVRLAYNEISAGSISSSAILDDTLKLTNQIVGENEYADSQPAGFTSQTAGTGSLSLGKGIVTLGYEATVAKESEGGETENVQSAISFSRKGIDITTSDETNYKPYLKYNGSQIALATSQSDHSNGSYNFAYNLNKDSKVTLSAINSTNPNFSDDLSTYTTNSVTGSEVTKTNIEVDVNQINIRAMSSSASSVITLTPTSALLNGKQIATVDSIGGGVSTITNTSQLVNDSGFITAKDIPTVPTKTSQLTNDSGFITKVDLNAGSSKISSNDEGEYNYSGLSLVEDTSYVLYGGLSTNGTYTDATDLMGNIGEDVQSVAYIMPHHSGINVAYLDSSCANTFTVSDRGIVMSAVGDGETILDVNLNGAFIDEEQIATQTWVTDTLLGEGAHEDLNTISELSAALQNNKDIITTLNQAIGAKAAKTDIHSLTVYTANDDSYVASADGTFTPGTTVVESIYDPLSSTESGVSRKVFITRDIFNILITSYNSLVARVKALEDQLASIPASTNLEEVATKATTALQPEDTATSSEIDTLFE